MRDNQIYRYAQNRYMGGMSGGLQRGGAQYGFEMVTSAQYRQFHEMKSEMPSDVLELFKANEIGFLKAPIKQKCRPLDPVATIGMNLTEMFAIPNLEMQEQIKRETKPERIERIHKEKVQKNQTQIQEKMQEWDPFNTTTISSNPQHTLFVARLNYKTTQKQLKHEFERYGLIKTVFVPRDQDGKSRGYAFVEFENKEDFVHAYKMANQRKISGRRIIVDYERGRTLLNWRPRRFGGGLGDLRLTKEEARKQEELQRQRREEKLEKKSKSRSRSRDKYDRKLNDDKDRKRDKKDREREKDRERDRERDRRDRKRDRRDYSN